jgi:hypothetical protein
LISSAHYIIGPGLTIGVHTLSSADGQSSIAVSGSLFINATEANVLSDPGDNSGTTNLIYCTSYMTRLNPYCEAHASISQTQNYIPSAAYSIFFGGDVKVPSTTTGYIVGNTQFAVTGNTHLLAPNQINPEFITDVSCYPDDVPISTLVNTDFAVSSRSPALDTGAQVTSVKQLLSMF